MSKIIYDVYQNKDENNVSYGKYFGRIVHTETLNTRQLARHIADHGSVYTQDVVEGVLTKGDTIIDGLQYMKMYRSDEIRGKESYYAAYREDEEGRVYMERNQKVIKLIDFCTPVEAVGYPSPTIYPGSTLTARIIRFFIIVIF